MMMIMMMFWETYSSHHLCRALFVQPGAGSSYIWTYWVHLSYSSIQSCCSGSSIIFTKLPKHDESEDKPLYFLSWIILKSNTRYLLMLRRIVIVSTSLFSSLWAREQMNAYMYIHIVLCVYVWTDPLPVLLLNIPGKKRVNGRKDSSFS